MPEYPPVEGPTIEYRDRECQLRKATYRIGGGTALLLVDPATGKEVTRLTVNIPEVPLRQDEVLLRDFGASDGIMDVLETAGVISNTGRSVRCGKMELPICRLATPEQKHEQDRARTSGELGQTSRRAFWRER